jgi:hypothetical protein
MRLLTVVKIGAIVGGVWVAALFLRTYWPELDLLQQLSSSSTARWWRCRSVPYPRLAADDAAWTLTYSWKGGMGPGDVTLMLSSDGRAKLTSIRHDQSLPSIMDYKIQKGEISRIAKVVDSSGVFCQSDYARDGYIVFDLGRYSLDVTSENFSKNIIIDGCQTIPDPSAFAEVADALITLKPSLGDSIRWGPYGTASVPTTTPCTNQEQEGF